MAMLDFWHPVMRSQDLPSAGAAGARLAGRSLAVFRPGPGRVAAIEDLCPHRRMKLSLGTVRSGRLVCPYHGWSFDAAGEGESPTTPKVRACVAHFQCREAHGAVWVRALGADAPLPALDFGDHLPVGVVVHRVRAPLELVIDNFSEIEHTVAVHPAIGIDPRRAHKAAVTFDVTDRAVTVHNTGPAKPPPLFNRLMLLFRKRFLFHSDYTFTFDPPRSVVDHRWSDPAGGRGAMLRYRLHHFFVPEDPLATRIVTFAAMKSRWPVGPGGGVRPFRWLVRRMIRTSINEDVWLLENLADQSVSPVGMTLTKFDKVLGLTRERLNSTYYS
jgi:phenylpropionate dioxygenase-like ring-hydroxylating dioxygenase large terminal subunit